MNPEIKRILNEVIDRVVDQIEGPEEKTCSKSGCKNEKKNARGELTKLWKRQREDSEDYIYLPLKRHRSSSMETHYDSDENEENKLLEVEEMERYGPCELSV